MISPLYLLDEDANLPLDIEDSFFIHSFKTYGVHLCLLLDKSTYYMSNCMTPTLFYTWFINTHTYAEHSVGRP